MSPNPSTIHHDSPTIVVVPTVVVCCPSAAPTRQARRGVNMGIVLGLERP
jgi:hypothetical protein